MLYLYQSQESGKYRFYCDDDFTFSIIGFVNIAKGYRHFSDCILNGSYSTPPANYTLIASSPTIESFPDLYPELFI